MDHVCYWLSDNYKCPLPEDSYVIHLFYKKDELQNVRVGLYFVQFYTVELFKFLFSHFDLSLKITVALFTCNVLLLHIFDFKRFVPFFHRGLSKFWRNNVTSIQRTTTIIKSNFKGNFSNSKMTRWVFAVSAILPKKNSQQVDIDIHLAVTCHV